MSFGVAAELLLEAREVLEQEPFDLHLIMMQENRAAVVALLYRRRKPRQRQKH